MNYLSKLFLTFLFTTLLGSIVAFGIERAKQKEAEKKIAIGLYYDSLDTISKLCYYSIRSLDFEKDVAEDWYKRYLNIYTYYRERLFRNRGLFIHSFGKNPYLLFTNDIHPNIEKLHQEVVTFHMQDGESAQSIFEIVEEIDRMSNELTKEILKTL